jgi:hypothetical protein
MSTKVTTLRLPTGRRNPGLGNRSRGDLRVHRRPSYPSGIQGASSEMHGGGPQGLGTSDRVERPHDPSRPITTAATDLQLEDRHIMNPNESSQGGLLGRASPLPIVARLRRAFGRWECPPRVVCGASGGASIRWSGGYSPLRQGVAVSEVEELGANHWPEFGSVALNPMGVTGLEPVTSALSRRRSPN